MESTLVIELILLAFLFGASACFSSCETALVSLSAVRLKTIKQQHPSKAKYFDKWTSEPSHLITTLLIGNNIVNISAAIVSESILARYMKVWALPEWVGVVLSIGVVSLVVLLLCEITPKIIAYQNSEKVALFLIRTIVTLDKVFLPLRYTLMWFSNMIIRVTGGNPDAAKRVFMTEGEFLHIVDKVEEEGVIEAEARDMILGVFGLGDMQVREIMVPKPDVDCISVTSTVEMAARFADTAGRSRIPVYENGEDNIIGIVNTKTLLKAMRKGDIASSLHGLLHEPFFVPDTKLLADLLHELQAKRLHMAIVVDEYGSFSGVVTLEDIIEEIVGEIRDEYDTEEPLFRWMDDVRIKVNARMDITELNEVISTGQLPDDNDYESVGGLIYDTLGRIPRQGETVTVNDLDITVEKMNGTRIESVIINMGSHMQQPEDG